MILLDGGIGSEMDIRLSRTVNDDPGWCACNHISNPKELRDIYEDFVNSGSRMLSANTYSILQYLLNVEDSEIELSVMSAVNILKELRHKYPNIIIAGCLSAHNCNGHDDDKIKRSISLLARCLAKSGVDYILVEMVQNKRIGKIMIDAADAVGLPLIVGFSVVREGCLKMKTKDVDFTEDVIEHVIGDAQNVVCVGVMHSDVQVLDEALCVIEKVWLGDLSAYPDHGKFENNTWTSEANDFLIDKIVESLIVCKANHPKLRVVGGCCGLGPSYIKKLQAGFASHLNDFALSVD